MQVYRLESSQSPFHGGILLQLHSGNRKQIAWQSKNTIVNTLDFAKKCVTAFVDHCLQQGLIDELDRTNIPSLVAAVQHHVQGFNARLVAHQRSPSPEPGPASH